MPVFPTATHTLRLCTKASKSHCFDTGSLARVAPPVGGPPRLPLRISAPSPRAQAKASLMSSSLPPGCMPVGAVRALALSSCTSGATPRWGWWLLAMQPATAVPCPLVSSAVPLVVKSCASSSRSTPRKGTSRSGCAPSTPESMMPTVDRPPKSPKPTTASARMRGMARSRAPLLRPCSERCSTSSRPPTCNTSASVRSTTRRDAPTRSTRRVGGTGRAASMRSSPAAERGDSTTPSTVPTPPAPPSVPPWAWRTACSSAASSLRYTGGRASRAARVRRHASSGSGAKVQLSSSRLAVRMSPPWRTLSCV